MSRQRKRKKKKPGFDPATQARRLARALLGAVPGVRIETPEKKKKKPKHRKREQEREWEG